MTLVLNTTKQIALDDLLEGLERYGITIVTGCEAEPIVYLCLAGMVLRACQDDNGFCYFVVPDNADLPWPIFDAIFREYDCGIERMVDSRGRTVSSFDNQAVIDFLGEDHLEPGDLLLRCISGKSANIEPGSTLSEKTEIGRGLVDRNPRLKEDGKTLLVLVEDLYAQRHPPFKVTLHKRSPVVAQLMAEAMLAWAQAGQQTHQPANDQSEPNNTEFPLAPDQAQEWPNLREEEGRKIDPETAEVTWRWGLTLDPYGIHPDLPEEARQIQRNYFARSPGSEIWVLFDDLPEATREILSERNEVDILTFWRNQFRETQA